MPALTGSPVFTSLDVQARLIALLNADARIQSAFQNTSNIFNPVLDDDPTNVEQAENAILAVTISGEGEEDATLGREMGGTFDLLVAFTAILYFWEGEERLASVKRNLVTAANITKQAIMRNSQLTGVPAGGSSLLQLSWNCEFRPILGRLSTIYYPADGYRVARIGFDMTGRQAYN